MQLHQLQPNTPRAQKKRVGRGGKRGKTSGRGMKGQKARAGNSMRPEERDFIKKLPKLRGHGKNRAQAVHSGRVRPVGVNLSALAAAFPTGGAVSPQVLAAHGLVRTSGKRTPQVKILGTGELSAKLTVSGCAVSGAARAKIEAAGGSVA